MLFSGGLLVASLPAMASSLGLPARSSNNPENVILADCTRARNTSELSSEVSYFKGAPDDTPDDVAVVTTDRHQNWANTTTKAFFADTNTTFTAVLRERGDAGDYAGTGDNGYGTFTCWQMASTYLYTHTDKNCFVVYDCNHSGAPATLPPISVTSDTSSTSESPASASSSSSHSHLSAGAIVGLSIGVAVGAILLAGVAAIVVWRHRNSKKEKAAASVQEKGLGGGASGLPKSPQSTTAIWQGPGARELETPHVVHELHSENRPVEIHGEALRGELDDTGRVELHNQDLTPRYIHEEHVSPGAYGNFKGPV
ncbi:hypothetical protein M426DRAFT_325127 [Hypoxylon sp. CI-4A]|nr:hypothetical protein M426DRAFT_325127 [Hypoxylon sp. CI-4A]